MTKFIFSAITLFALPLLLSAQTTTVSNKRLALSVAPNTAFIGGDESIVNQNRLAGFHTRADVEFRLVNRLWLRAGAGVSLLRYENEVKLDLLQWPSQNNGNGQYDPNLAGETTHQYFKQTTLMIPIALRYYFGKKEQFYADLEGTANWILGSSNDSFQPGIGLAAGWQTAICRETWIFVQPSFRMMFYKNPILKNNKWQSYSPALELGVRRGL